MPCLNDHFQGMPFATSPVIRSSLIHLLMISIILCGNRSSCRLDELKTSSASRYWNFSSSSNLRKDPVSVTLKNLFTQAESLSSPSTSQDIFIIPTAANTVDIKSDDILKESSMFVETIVGGNLQDTTSSCEESREPVSVEVKEQKDFQVLEATQVQDSLQASAAIITPSSSQEESPPSVAEAVPPPAINDTLSEPKEPANQTSEPDKLVTSDTDHMPSFDEWKRKKQAEQIEGEKPAQTLGLPPGGTGVTGSGNGVPANNVVPPGKKVAVNPKRRRNYASFECGAKVVASNRESEGAGRILNEQMDEYMLNPCKAKIWFVIELCDTIQANQLELANFELFSSLPKDFTVSSSDQYPTRDWIPLGTFLAQDQRTLHTFQLMQHGYGKFLKVELHGHYGKEHYCPLSVVRVFGTSMVDEFEDLEATGNVLTPSDDDDKPVIPSTTQTDTSNAFFGSAKEVVMTFVRKAAEALGRDKTQMPAEGDAIKDSNLSFQSQLTGELFPEHKQHFEGPHLQCDSRETILYKAAAACGFCPTSTPLVHSNKCRLMWAIFNVSSIKTFCEHSPCQSYREASSVITKQLKNTEHLDKPVPGSSSQSSTLNASESMKLLSPASVTGTVMLDSSRENIQSGSSTANLTDSTEQIKTDSLPSISVTNVDTSFTSSEALVAPLQSSIIEPSLTSTETAATPAVESTMESTLLTDTIEELMPDMHHTLEDESQMRGGARSDQIGIPVSSTQKESVFVRLNNRIRLLEVNLSLSSQYLQELSQRYRRQMEDMQRAFNRTVGALNQTAIKAAERDKQQQASLAALQKQMDYINGTVEKLRTQNRTLYKEVLETHIFLIAVEAIVVITFLTLCWRRYRIQNFSSMSVCSNPGLDFERESSEPLGDIRTPLKRHHSVCDFLMAFDGTKKRRPSESVSTAGTYSDLMIVEPAIPIYIEQPHKARKRHRNRKNRNSLARSVSNPNLSCQKVSLTGTCRNGQLSPISSPAAGVLFFPSNQDSNENCENCSPEETEDSCQAKVPFQNLTNPRIKKDESGACKDHFSLKKLMKLNSKKGAI